MFKKILIANRGEIACRVMRTARRLGIATVAVYSEVDSGALHVREADEAIFIGGSASAESYLVREKIIDAVRQSGAEAVHPGYGFLSENASFAEALEAEGIVFIGPRKKAIAAMGDKIESKKLAAQAGVSTVPGYVGVLADDTEAVKVAGDIGYPVMIKASAGGGGKGMRVAYNEDEVKEGFRSAVNEAVSSFGDDRVFIEKFIEEPRHIEIQIIADTKGNTIYLGERECSIQRRHQKVVEEAPSPFLDPQTRKLMGEQSVLLSKTVEYCSAGTVEFIVDKNKNFYFLEMNTRLQVEHPVTECITGLDLVELMIRIAAGEELPLQQKDVSLDGWAIETRIYAEDPYRGFLPSTGRLVKYQQPENQKGVRIDSGVTEGSEISIFYDPMIAKLVTSGDSRKQAIDRMELALNSFKIRGVNHNIDFLSAVMTNPRFQQGEFNTGFIAEEFPTGFKGTQLSNEIKMSLYSIAVAFEFTKLTRNKTISGRVELPLRANFENTNYIYLSVFDEGVWINFKLEQTTEGFSVSNEKRTIRLDGTFNLVTKLFDGFVDGVQMIVQVEQEGGTCQVKYNGCELQLKLVPSRLAQLVDLMPVKQAPDMSRYLLSPMPGLLVSIAVSEGQSIKAGQELAVVEAMKMENVMKAEQDGIVSKVHANIGESLTVDQILIEFE
ncbi:acetyl/propionyl/methylcrotonyl-CoA carboxylase subunit alpha [Rhodospirillaceae bacterium]|nr:acetyl/propionyl/methylcrotonyl-CoA carboxylase subunit alpha [Rhodospirillaceae bacterium]MBT7732416.1 acetyl/propionyl/methylcrotonyl-CoA carboxylase subunit alpha [Rhodospirillaceae bacterium]MDC0998635.1 acetyl/propionyl/methylcrotonyl-CoA carboxylase subunit alpha [Alphaproteobacteria bacterium]MDC1442382.1 acetyl/propionyl/methylcrotonyl-CoA carboxylase subunit alpha [Rhodospirillaceae bacterium]